MKAHVSMQLDGKYRLPHTCAAAAGRDGLLTLTYLALTCFTALVPAVAPAWLAAVTVHV
jgi:ABC-type transporter Mla subunit MlaD